MDIATIVGVFFGFSCIIMSIVAGTDIAIFVHIPSMLITVGGMISATLIHFSLPQFMSIAPIVKKTFFWKMPSMQKLIQDMVNYSAISRRDGALALEQQIANVHDPFLIKSLQMVVDGQDQEFIENSLFNEIHYLQERHQEGKKIMEFMGASAPSFGMIGTLIGLVAMLTSLDDPKNIGAGMAVALITTFYGALLANLLFIPLAGKLGIRSKQESLMREMIVEGVVGIVKGEAPTEVRERMQTFISAKNREELKPTLDAKKQQAA